jgi:hypothetical protein
MIDKGRYLMRTTALALAFTLLASTGFAHEPRKGPNGGDLVDAGAYHVEIVGKGSAVEVFVSDSLDRPLSATGFKALAIIVIDGKTQRVSLTPANDGKMLSGVAPAPIKAIKGAIQLTDKDGKTTTGRVN